MPPYASASALAHQAFWPAEQRQAFGRRYPLAEYGGHLWANAAELDRYLKTVRVNRLAQPTFPIDQHHRAAAPVFLLSNELHGTLGAYLPAEDAESADFDRIVDAIDQAARQLSQGPQP